MRNFNWMREKRVRKPDLPGSMRRGRIGATERMVSGGLQLASGGEAVGRDGGLKSALRGRGTRVRNGTTWSELR